MIHSYQNIWIIQESKCTCTFLALLWEIFERHLFMIVMISYFLIVMISYFLIVTRLQFGNLYS